MSYALTDEVYATTVKEMEGNKKEKYLFYGSAMITFWAIWVLADFLGALVGASFPHIEIRSRFRHGRRLYRHRGAAN